VTGAEFSEVDFDRLADYVGGALTGTPDDVAVAALIAGDPAWQAAHDDLVAAMASVGAELNALGALPEPMPAELARRLDATFASAVSDPAPIDPELAAPAVPFVVRPGPDAASERHLAAVPDQGVDRAERPSVAARRRRLRWAAPIAAAAGVIAFLGVGINYLNGQSESQSDKSASSAAGAGSGEVHDDSGDPKSAPLAAESGQAAPGQAAPAQAAPAQILASGQDYQRATLGSAGVIWQDDPRSTTAKAPRALAGETGALARLAPADALAACLQAIAQQNASGRLLSVRAVDYARLDGSPALIVRFTAANGQWVWATGPNCGLPGSGAAQLAAVKVG
jgi:hypothetical protein